MENLRIDIYLETPVLLNRQTYFDGVLAFCAVAEAERDLQAINRLPLKKSGGVYHASTWEISQTSQSIVPSARTVVKLSMARDLRRDLNGYLDETDIGQTVLIEGSGKYKGYVVQLAPQTIRCVTFYACGNRHAISELLNRHLRSLGAKAALGMGAIERIEIEAIPEDLSLLKDGKVMRPISKPMAEEVGLAHKLAVAPIGYYRALPPYWRRDGLEECYLPSAVPVIQ